MLTRSNFNEKIRAIKDNKTGFSGFSEKTKLAKLLKRTKDYLWISLVSEVFYARAIDISIHTSRSFGGALNAQPITNATLNELSRLENLEYIRERRSGIINVGTATTNLDDLVLPGFGTSTGNINLPDTQGRGIVANITLEREQLDPFTLANRINEANAQLGNQSVPGGSINIVSVSDSAIGLRRNYDRPIAVGVRGMVLKVNYTVTKKIEIEINGAKEKVEFFKIELDDGSKKK